MCTNTCFPIASSRNPTDHYVYLDPKSYEKIDYLLQNLSSQTELTEAQKDSLNRISVSLIPTELIRDRKMNERRKEETTDEIAKTLGRSETETLQRLKNQFESTWILDIFQLAEIYAGVQRANAHFDEIARSRKLQLTCNALCNTESLSSITSAIDIADTIPDENIKSETLRSLVISLCNQRHFHLATHTINSIQEPQIQVKAWVELIEFLDLAHEDLENETWIRKAIETAFQISDPKKQKQALEEIKKTLSRLEIEIEFYFPDSSHG